MKNLFNLSTALIVVAGLLWAGCATTNTTSEAKYIGDWEYTVSDTPNGDVSGVMTITKEGSDFSAVLVNDMGEMNVDNLVIKDEKLSGTFDIQDMTLDIKGEFKGASFSGSVSLDYNDFPLEMTKK